jgi:SPP1 family predicted phage head-tail adaptor
MNIGRMRHRVILQSKTSTQDGTGAPIDTWATEKTIWVDISPLNSREYWAAQQVQSDVTHKVSMRYYSGIQPHWRVKYGTRVFDITSVINVGERNEYHILLCREFLT